MGRVESLLGLVGVFCIGWVSRGLFAPPPGVAPPTSMPRGLVHDLMVQLQVDDPYIVTKGVAPY